MLTMAEDGSDGNGFSGAPSSVARDESPAVPELTTSFARTRSSLFFSNIGERRTYHSMTRVLTVLMSFWPREGFMSLSRRRKKCGRRDPTDRTILEPRIQTRRKNKILEMYPLKQ